MLSIFQFCSCKNTCSKGSGRKKRGCPCRDEGLRCADACECGTKKASCKNKERSSGEADPQNTDAGLNAFQRHQIAMEKAKQQISVSVFSIIYTTLLFILSKQTCLKISKDLLHHNVTNEEQKDRVLLELLSNGKGSLDYAKNIVEFGGTVQFLPATKPGWCTCGDCRPMPTEEENKCCGKIRCVTSFVTFQNTCTDRDVLVMAIRGRCDIRAEELDYSTNSFRKAAYRQYILWRYKKLGRGNRRVCPSCVVLAIRQLYPAQDGIYMGFKRA